MSIPYQKAAVYFESFPLFETSTALGIAGTISMPGFFDTVDLLPARHGSAGFSGGTIYDYTPTDADPRWWLHYHIHAEATGSGDAQAPGVLFIQGNNINPATGTPGAAGRIIATVTYNGTGVAILNAAGTTTRHDLTGSLPLTHRLVNLLYVNGPIAQTAFQLGVYLRATP